MITLRQDFCLALRRLPERMDGRDVLRLCDYNIAYEARLFDAIDQGWLVPFQYFAIHDETDYSAIRWTGMDYDEKELERSLSTDTRAEIIVRNLKQFLPATGKIKALAAFCEPRPCSGTWRQFNRRGFVAECLLGDSSEEARARAIEKFKDEDDPLQVICSVDIFGEGVDIPPTSHVLLLRPTSSFTVFLQQLGRGLRPARQGDLVALDFVGNSPSRSLALRGCTSLEDFQRKRRRGFACLPVVLSTWTPRLSRVGRRDTPCHVPAKPPRGFAETLTQMREAFQCCWISSRIPTPAIPGLCESAMATGCAPRRMPAI